MKKNITILAAVFLVLLIILFINRMSDKTVVKANYFIDIDTTKVTKLHFISPEKGEVTLSKASGMWRVVEPIDYLADARNMGQTLSQLMKMEIENLVTGREDQKSAYEVDSAGTLIEVYEGGKLLTAFYMGKNAPTYRHTYMRKTDSDDIYMVKSTFRYQFNRELKDWRDKIIMELNKDDVREMDFRYPDEQFTLQLSDTIWTLHSDKTEFTADKKLVDRILNYLSKLRTGDFYNPDSAEALDWSKPEFSMKVIALGGNIRTIMIQEKPGEQNQYYLKLDDNPTVFIVYKGTAATLMKKIDDFRVKEEDKEKAPKKPPEMFEGQ
ncbi:DUF4340 domain-containing protein [bacterium]|nr:DUF4340 domain-containing protein [FCB group bacterium]MBL7191662.1 DUF4340 domain-containing protein [bacterium]